jgi:hypothetical protein
LLPFEKISKRKAHPASMAAAVLGDHTSALVAQNWKIALNEAPVGSSIFSFVLVRGTFSRFLSAYMEKVARARIRSAEAGHV